MATKASDTADRELRISRTLNAPIDLVWEVWTDPEHIRNWWGPDGFTNTIHHMHVEPGGEWDFVMHGPDGTDYKNRNIFKEVVKHKRLVYEHASAPKFIATIQFEEQGDKTQLSWHMLFESKELFIQTVKTFKADVGLMQNIDKLNSYVQAQFTLRKQLKPDTRARACTYLNFPGTTEEAFTFYKTVFGGEFTGKKGIQRLGDLPPMEGQPPLSEADKKLILHIELTIMGGYVLMATDAPPSMGFSLSTGNTMYISLEPGSKEETRRLYDAIAEGGTITEPLKDLPWGLYYGSVTDKYGINWMFNYYTN